MRKLLLLTIFLHIFSIQPSLFAQVPPPPPPPAAPAPSEPKPPYMEEKGMPSFNILKLDSVTMFHTQDIPTGKKSILFFFNPGCSHCIVFLNKLFPAMDSFKNVNFYMMSLVPEMSKMRDFYKEYNVQNYKNIKVVGRDVEFFFLGHYAVKTFSAAAIYDEHKKVIKLLEGERLQVDELYKYTK